VLERLLESEENPLGPSIDLDSIAAGAQRYAPSRRVCAHVERCAGVWDSIFASGDPDPSGRGNSEL
jgi:hypothetical protein